MRKFYLQLCCKIGMLDFSNIRVICKNEYFKAFATQIRDVAPLALHMLLSCLSCLLVNVGGHTWQCDSVIMILISKLYVSVISDDRSSSFRFF